jgi:hypothetical protein
MECPSCKGHHRMCWAHPREPDRELAYAYTCPKTQEAVENIKIKKIKGQQEFPSPESVHVRRMPP